MRNGYEPKRVQTKAGLVQLAVPQLRATDERYRSAVIDRLGGRKGDLEALVQGMYVRGLFGETFGSSGLPDPSLLVIDGAPGLKKAVKRRWPRAWRQTLQMPKMRNTLAKLTRLMQARMKALVQQVFLAPSYPWPASAAGR